MAAQKPRISCEFFPPKTGAGIEATERGYACS